MKSTRAAIAVTLLVVLAASADNWWRTAPAPALAPGAPTARPRGAAPQPLVDRSALDAANHLVPLASTVDEQQLAVGAVAAADHVLDLEFAAALREATLHPPPPTPAAVAAQARLDRAAQRLVEDNALQLRLNAPSAKSKSRQSAALAGEAALAELQFEVDQDEFAQAGRELVAAGGDLRARIESLLSEHRAATPRPAAPVVVSESGGGLIHQLERWLVLRRKEHALEAARSQAGTAVEALGQERAALGRRIDSQPRAAQPAATPRARDESAALLAATQQLAEDRKSLAGIDDRIAAYQHLLAVYDEWRPLAAGQTALTLHRTTLSVATIAVVCLLLLFFGGWLDAAFGRLRLDRRQVETLRTVTTVALQIAAVIFIALVISGPPGQLGTFLGLAGAGLTVALKDFIVAFVGWLVLMGRNGIRLGDWVEINGVAGEVVELGMFHTVLLETGNWADSGHPTGRRVTFTNSYAIQGYYFNFSTSGQWLWDELQVVVPAGQNLYAVVDAISAAVHEATAENIRLAEEEWRKAAPSRKLTGLSAAPAISVKPVVGGTEITLRYIARASERYRLRGALYQKAVELLGGKPVASASSTRNEP